jgi:hypothetical protein
MRRPLAVYGVHSLHFTNEPENEDSDISLTAPCASDMAARCPLHSFPDFLL